MTEKATQEKQASQKATRCPNCGMPRNEWPDPDGVTRNGKTYCCEGCATGTGCTCEQ